MGVFRCKNCGALNRLAQARTGGHPICGRCKVNLDMTGEPKPVLGPALDDAVESSPIPVFVEFWATWCAPCRKVAPAIVTLAHHHAESLLVLKLDIDADPAAAQRYGIQAVPSFLLFQAGNEVGRRSGLLTLAELESWVAGTTNSSARDA